MNNDNQSSATIEDNGIISPTGHVTLLVRDHFGTNKASIEINADEYSTREALFKAAREQLKAKANYEPVLLSFSVVDAGFDANKFVKNGEVSDQLWAMMELELEGHQIEMLYAYMSAFGVSELTDLAKTLDKAERAYLGHFSSTTDMVIDFLEQREIDEATLKTLLPHINYGTYADFLMLDRKECDNHYFMAYGK